MAARKTTTTRRRTTTKAQSNGHSPDALVLYLSILQRVRLAAFLPDTGGALEEIIAIADLRDALVLTEDEMEKGQVTVPAPGQLSWRRDFTREYQLTDVDVRVLKLGADLLLRKGAFPTDRVSIDLYKKLDEFLS